MTGILCKKCNKNNPGQARFCGGCGSPLQDNSPTIGETDIEALFESSFTDTTQTKEQFDPERSDLFGAEVKRQSTGNIDDVFKTSGDDSSLESIFDEYVEVAESEGFHNSESKRSNDRGYDSNNESEQKGLIDEAFHTLIEQKNEDGQHIDSMDASSPSAALLEDDILALAESAIENDEGSNESSLDETSRESSPVHEDEPSLEDNESDTDESETRGTTISSARKKDKKARKSRAIPDSLKRARLIGQATFVSGAAGAGTFLVLSLAATYLLFPMIPAQLPQLAILGGPVLALAGAFILKKIFKEKTWPFPVLNVLIVAFIFGFAFHLTGKVTYPQGISPGILQSIAMTLSLVTAIHFINSSKLLHRIFRYVLVTLGVYSICGLLKGLATGITYEQTVVLRQLSPSGDGNLIHELARLFEPTFTGVNLFLPLVIIVLLFETMRLVMHKFFRESLAGLVTLVFLGACLYTNINVYETLNVPNLKQMIKTGSVLSRDTANKGTSTSP